MVVRHTLGIFFRAYSRIKYGARIKPFKEEGKRQYLVLFNHQTAFDQFFVALSFRQHLYFLASEDIFSKGLLSAALLWLFSAGVPREMSVGTSLLMYLGVALASALGGSVFGARQSTAHRHRRHRHRP